MSRDAPHTATRPQGPETPLYLAPMVTLTHAGVRHLIEEYGGCDRYYTEMISAEAITAHSEFRSWYLDLQPAPERTIYQFLFRDAEAIARVAAEVAELGALGIDLNMGCSAPHIARGGGGIAWMQRPDEARRAVAAARATAPRAKLSVKLRLGERRAVEPVAEFAEALCREGLDEITLHPKTRSEPESRPADWRFIAELQERVPVPVNASGGVTSVELLHRRIDRFRPAAVMIGREAIRSPWIFAHARGRRIEVDRRVAADRFLELLVQHQPPEFHATRAKRFFQYYTQPLRWGARLFQTLKKCASLAEIRMQVHEYLEQHPEERFPGVGAGSDVALCELGELGEFDKARHASGVTPSRHGL